MITAFDVYLVMQLDSIKVFFTLLSVAIFCVGVFFAGVFLDENEEASWKVSVAPIFGVVLGAISAFLPSSQTAAAMIIFPAISSAEFTGVVAPEVKEVWELAKEALRTSVSSHRETAVEKGGASK